MMMVKSVLQTFCSTFTQQVRACSFVSSGPLAPRNGPNLCLSLVSGARHIAARMWLCFKGNCTVLCAAPYRRARRNMQAPQLDSKGERSLFFRKEENNRGITKTSTPRHTTQVRRRVHFYKSAPLLRSGLLQLHRERTEDLVEASLATPAPSLSR